MGGWVVVDLKTFVTPFFFFGGSAPLVGTSTSNQLYKGPKDTMVRRSHGNKMRERNSYSNIGMEITRT